MAKDLCANIIYFYLNTDIDRFEYMKIKANIIPEEIMSQYNLAPLVNDGWVYIGITKGMHGLPHAGLLVNVKLTKHLAKYGSHPTKYTPRLWTHESRPIAFTLIVDDFLIKYSTKADADHLLSASKDQYIISEDWEAHIYCGFTLD